MARVDERSASIRALVVDDEPLARRNVTVLLRGDPDIGSIEECGSGVEAIEAIRRWKPDLVFLDVQMPECGGFDVLELLGADLPQVVIFVTAYDEYALRAFEAGALDYLLKPFDDARFGRALHRAKDKLAHYGPLQPQPAKRLVVRSPGQLLFVNVSDIDWIEAASYYACLHVGRDTHIIRRTPVGARAGSGRGNVHPHSPLDHREPRSDPWTGAAERRRVRGRLEVQGSVAIEPALPQAASGSHGRDVRKRLGERRARRSAERRGFVARPLCERGVSRIRPSTSRASGSLHPTYIPPQGVCPTSGLLLRGLPSCVIDLQWRRRSSPHYFR